MTEIIFVRHGESDMNKEGVFCGWSNSPLTPNGIKQAEKVRDKLKKEKLNLVITSDLDRCLNTASIINSYHKVDMIKESGLKEINFGKWEGLSYNEIHKNFPKESKLWEEDYLNYPVPSGESLREMYTRVNQAFNKIKEKYSKEKILIVSHSGVIRAILSKEICGSVDGYWKFKINNCSLTRLEYVDGFPVLKAIND